MRKITLFFAPLFCLFQFLSAQKNPQLINSGEIIRQADKLYEKENYQEAYEQLLQIGRNDTNYQAALGEIAANVYRMGKYDTVLNVARELTESDYYAGLDGYTWIGNALDGKKKYDSAIVFYQSLIKKFPRAFQFQYNLGVEYYKAKKADEALAAFRRALDLNPRHPSSHYFIGLILADNKMWAPALLALNTTMLLQPYASTEANCRSVMINIAKGDYSMDVGGGLLSEAEDPVFAKIDKLIESQVAFSKGFKIATNIEDKLMKQTQFLLENLKQSPPKSNSFFVQEYVPFFMQMLEPQWIKTFLYYPYKGLDNDIVKKWKSKNKKEIAEFERWTADHFVKECIDHTDTINGAPVHVKRNYFANGALMGVGEDYDNKTEQRKGHWTLYYSNGLLNAKGEYDQNGKKTGEWKTYYSDETLYSITNYVGGKLEGPYKIYYQNGILKYDGNFKNDLLDGNVKGYYNSGAAKNVIDYKAGLYDGKYMSCHTNGNKDLVAETKSDKYDGLREQFAGPGYITSRFHEKEGKMDGDYVSFYNNGVVKQKGAYIMGKATGKWTYYFDNGKIYSEGDYKDGLINGNEKQYYRNGQLNCDRFYDAKGKATGAHVYFDEDGIKFFEGAYTDGRLTAYKYYDKTGKIIHQGTESRGEIMMEGYYPNGNLDDVGVYKKGDREDRWTRYYWGGEKLSVKQYSKGYENGPFEEYFKNGAVRKKGTYREGKLDGYYITYFENGKPHEELTYVNGNREGDAYTYYYDGSVKWHGYYHNDDETGWQVYYVPNGKKDCEYFMDEQLLTKYYICDSAGKVVFKYINPTGQGAYNLDYANGRPWKRATKVHGEYSGDFKLYYSSGQLQTEYTFVDGYAQGAITGYHMNGVVSKKGFYKNGDDDSIWSFYNDKGKLQSSGSYRNDNRNGYWTWYYPNGNKEYVAKYIDGDKDSLAVLMAPDGVVRIKFRYRYGNIVSYTYQGKDGKDVPEIPFEEKDVKVVSYYANGNKSFEGHYVNGFREGKFNYYYSDGKLQWAENYEKDLQTGVQTFYYADGKVEKEEDMLYDKQNGVTTKYDKSGNKESEEHYYLDMYHGTVKEYEMGKVKKESTYYYGTELR